MNFELPKIYPITDRTIAGLPHAVQVERFIRGGARFIQLREKTAPAGEFCGEALAALRVARRRPDVRIIINDRADIALVADAAGVHLGQEDLPPAAARQILGKRAIIGFSTHDVRQAVAAARLPIDYLAIGPVFPTRTKTDPDPTIGLAGVREVAAAVAGRLPLVAIGGIDRENFRDVLAAGADSVAMISRLLAEPDRIGERFREFDRLAKQL